ncbi:hypothetical protein SPRG_19698 [Saprolegnia parasitica CBS 223.65]|uniref:RWD domain-containing protein n=1 Tax=Saprolegnia parasitica (strain CBS 223.65) TaxID=695850 RepID=A0A067CTF6_SAPPC|nr:hypothetical protein SPRG_19698 [Saprolegnia parasitica CBS 223.65]KDO29811.1 hypothetical protein SPRG_19698 [Saprolegnia parasitica CBS 223.65]|eukprot:XP_012199521.1 hypothetical protein SPRG_19698 [Saprolegnia parasitica CBS 223.65]
MDRSAEVAAFQKLIPAANIETCTHEQLQASLQDTRQRKLRLRLRFPDEYPRRELLIEILSTSLPDVALRRLTKFADAKATELSKEGLPQVQAIVELVQTSLAENKLLFAFDEVRQLRLLADANGGEMKLVNERAGRIKVLLRQGPYFFQVNVKLDDHYPDSTIRVVCDESNLPPNVVDAIVKQANDMARRITLGYTADQALYASNPLKKPLSLLAPPEPTKKAGAKKFGKAAKAATSPIVIKEAPKEKIAPLYYAEDGGILHRSPLDEAVKSILPVVKTYLWETVLKSLPSTACPECAQLVLPTNPATALDPNAVPLQAYCGHWFHTECLGKKLQSPPFAHPCVACHVILHHPKWPSDLAELSTRYEREQRLEREIAEIADMF